MVRRVFFFARYSVRRDYRFELFFFFSFFFLLLLPHPILENSRRVIKRVPRRFRAKESRPRFSEDGEEGGDSDSVSERKIEARRDRQRRTEHAPPSIEIARR